MEERIMAGYYDRDRNPSGYGGANTTASGHMSHPMTYIGNTAEYFDVFRQWQTYVARHVDIF